jgi:hypothetical protein
LRWFASAGVLALLAAAAAGFAFRPTTKPPEAPFAGEGYKPPAPAWPSPEAKAKPERARPKPLPLPSRAVGIPTDGRLIRGIALPRQGEDFFTWDPVLRRSPNRSWRRFGTDYLVATVLDVVSAHRDAYPNAPRVGIGDLSRTHGGDFGPQWGGIGHVSHQNGLDVDVYYPRLDGRERAPEDPSQIDRALAQDLVDRFVRAGAVKIFVGPNTGLRGPRRVVSVLPTHHDNHMHVRLAPTGRVGTVRLGRSHRGRMIRAWRTGNVRADRSALVVGCIHGNECAGVAVARRLLRVGRNAPVGLWIVPHLNPDGYARGVRQNARGVDLNRNFPVDWRPIGRPWDGYHSGPRPFSERESRIAARLIARVRPELTVWYHQPQANVRITGRSAPLARRYARLVGLPFRPLGSPPGAATAWQRRHFPRAHAFVVELPAGPLSAASADRHAHAVLRLLSR